MFEKYKFLPIVSIPTSRVHLRSLYCGKKGPYGSSAQSLRRTGIWITMGYELKTENGHMRRTDSVRPAALWSSHFARALRKCGDFVRHFDTGDKSENGGNSPRRCTSTRRRERVYAALTNGKQFQQVVLLSDAMQSGMVKATHPAQIAAEAGGAFAIFWRLYHGPTDRTRQGRPNCAGVAPHRLASGYLFDCAFRSAQAGLRYAPGIRAHWISCRCCRAFWRTAGTSTTGSRWQNS